MDMPDHCLRCPMLGGGDECILQDEDANFKASDSWEELRKNCPLRKVPEKKEENKTNDWTYNVIYKRGYNACIDEILRR